MPLNRMSDRLASNAERTAGKCAAARKALGPKYLMLLAVAAAAFGLSACGLFGDKGKAEEAGDEPARDPVAECRDLAPDDPYENDEVTAELAYAACYEAAQQAPGDAEIIYMLGTSAFQSRRMDEAAGYFRKAEGMGYCKALYFLGEDAWYGRQDADGAEEYYKRGAACGDGRAAAELFSPEKFTRSARPELIAALYNSDIKKLNEARFVNASYVAGFYEALCEQYQGVHMETCWKVNYCRGGEVIAQLQAAEKGDAPNVVEGYAYEWLLPKAYQVFVPSLGSQALEEFRKSERAAGSGDELRMVESSNCKGLVPYKIVNGIELFAKSRRSLLEIGQASSPNVRSLADLSAWLQQRGQKASAGAPPTR